MADPSRRLGDLAFLRARQDPEYWRVTEIGPAEKDARRNPARGRAALTWLDRSRDRKRPTAYQLCLAMHIAAATRR